MLQNHFCTYDFVVYKRYKLAKVVQTYPSSIYSY
jgi:hypothetical protein